MKRSDFSKPTGHIIHQFVRYFISGGVAFCVDFLLMMLLHDRFNIIAEVAGTISFAVGLVITYLMSIFWIFNQRRFNNRIAEFLGFTLIGIVGLVLTYFIMKIFTNSLQINYLLSKIVSTIIVTLWNFLAKKYFLFYKK
ncbi:MAG: GtrA family protein [Candidatus Aphodosoma sp.]